MPSPCTWVSQILVLCQISDLIIPWILHFTSNATWCKWKCPVKSKCSQGTFSDLELAFSSGEHFFWKTLDQLKYTSCPPVSCPALSGLAKSPQVIEQFPVSSLTKSINPISSDPRSQQWNIKILMTEMMQVCVKVVEHEILGCDRSAGPSLLLGRQIIT